MIAAATRGIELFIVRIEDWVSDEAPHFRLGIAGEYVDISINLMGSMDKVKVSPIVFTSFSWLGEIAQK